jgi:hypothetical protein
MTEVCARARTREHASEETPDHATQWRAQRGGPPPAVTQRPAPGRRAGPEARSCVMPAAPGTGALQGAGDAWPCLGPRTLPSFCSCAAKVQQRALEQPPTRQTGGPPGGV